MDISAIAALTPVVPVLTIERQAVAIPLAQALVRGGLRVLEITLRTGVALEALRAIVGEVPDAVVGAGTVLNGRQLEQARQAGARFAVSPGCTPGLAAAAAASGLPLLPGVQTVSEAMSLAERGFTVLKFFPAEPEGGLAWLKAVAAPLAGLRFCPTGGIGLDTAPAYLSLANVACVGGSWMAPGDAIAAQDWARIERLAAAAANLKRP
ncbi:bifunctional 4-hydroxy-2-oxoglutarate aldolase/2-dehydro-3-deoxy-phosphogluconate aldolase [Reyranella sp.]|uniref:bifunctional 4-hydroxy-2-oxoglutarate aldolase/2-dehydro-3-deoxy-phosphogluconate aldolase n=1 Tax=Reyranella sp. TaxID=1929291 RepID=UPI00272F56EB|nr:bifunctional 4-hydroxy-2-oxoglutarate aldolase/2-dehydro-3-deoxy-phosphogluconate aldolase [Reyranella sp.]MDP2373537.1 bifunctional 4-hydroxy-2-oxoglutarate aldolase/2-dehydro-3-deoxy-phosphogluconate aldolase [Reyranella sp.]